MSFARELWQRVETINAVVYFDDAPTDAAKGLGADGFWMSYFGLRAAPMGPVAPAVVEATFFNFSAAFVRRWVPSVWGAIDPSAWLDARPVAVGVALRRHDPRALEQALTALPELVDACDRAPAAGRPLFAANRDIDAGADPVAQLWQACTSLREHRGDGHVAALTAAGLDGLESHVLIALEHAAPTDMMQRSRGWTEADWDAAVERLAARGLVTADRRLSQAGVAFRAEIESTTDRLASAPFDALDDAARRRLLDELTPLAAVIARSGVLRYPNPMSLPAFDAAAAVTRSRASPST